MLKKLFTILFTFICTLSIFAENHDIHSQITEINVEIEKLKNEIGKHNIQKSIKSLEKKVQELDLDNKNVDVTIKNDLKPLLSELIKLNQIDKKDKSWSPSDWGTVAIALLTFFLVLFTGFSVYLLRVQNKEQKTVNAENLDLLKAEYLKQEKQNHLGQLEKQISDISEFMKKEFYEKRNLNRDLANDLLKKMNWIYPLPHNQSHLTWKETNEEIQVLNGDLNPSENLLTIKKDSIFGFLIKSKGNIGKKGIVELIKNNSYVTAELNTFISQLTYLILLIDDALSLGYNRKRARYILSMFYTISQFLYEIEILDISLYMRFKMYLIHSIYGSNELNISDNIKEEYIYEINVHNKHLELTIKEEDIIDIKIESSNENHDLIIKIKLILSLDKFFLERDELGKWTKVLKD